MGRCTKCEYRRDVLVPCEWLEQQPVLVLDCPHFKPREGGKLETKEEKDNAQHEV